MKLRVLVLASVVMVALGGQAGADDGSVEDARDTGDVMDLAEASHGHRFGLIEHGIAMHDPWRPDDFLAAELYLWLPDGEPNFDRRFLVLVDDEGRFRVATHTSRHANAFQSSETSLTIQFPVKVLKRNLSSYRWKAVLHYPCSRDPNVQCAPPPPDTHQGRVTHRLH